MVEPRVMYLNVLIGTALGIIAGGCIAWVIGLRLTGRVPRAYRQGKLLTPSSYKAQFDALAELMREAQDKKDIEDIEGNRYQGMYMSIVKRVQKEREQEEKRKDDD